jgi:hypothetical protein
MLSKMGMSGLGGLGGLGGLAGLGGKGGKINMGALQSHLQQNMKNAKTKKRIQSKLQKKQQQKQQQQQQQQPKPIPIPPPSNNTPRPTTSIYTASSGEQIQQTPRSVKPSCVTEENVIVDTNTLTGYEPVNDSQKKKKKKNKHKKVIDIFLIKNKTPLYETACDNQGFRLAKTKYIIEIQSDIHIEDFGFDRKMIDGMNKLNLGAVSGRHVHYFSMLEGRRAWLKYPFSLLSWRFFHSAKEGEGRLGHKIFSRTKKKMNNECFVGETVARGPWLLNKFDLEKLSYLDEKNFFLGNDDHDYHRRLFNKLGKSVGYIPLNIYSVIEDGATRKQRQGINKLIYEYFSINKKGSDEFRSFLRWYRPFKPIQKFDL